MAQASETFKMTTIILLLMAYMCHNAIVVADKVILHTVAGASEREAWVKDGNVCKVVSCRVISKPRISRLACESRKENILTNFEYRRPHLRLWCRRRDLFIFCVRNRLLSRHCTHILNMCIIRLYICITSSESVSVVVCGVWHLICAKSRSPSTAIWWQKP